MRAPFPHSHISHFHPILHFSFLHITHDDAGERGEGGTFGHYRVCKAAEQLSSWAVLCRQVMQRAVPPPQRISLSVDGSVGSTWGDVGAGIRAKGGWEFLEWRAVSACRESMVTAAAEGNGGKCTSCPCNTATGAASDKQDKCQKCLRNTKTGSVEVGVGSVRFGSGRIDVVCLTY